MHLAVLQRLLRQHVFGDPADAAGGGECCLFVLFVPIAKPAIAVDKDTQVTSKF